MPRNKIAHIGFVREDGAVRSDEWDGKIRWLFKHICQTCGDEFLAPKSRNSKFCSRRCFSDGNIDRDEFICPICGVKFDRNKSQVKRSRSGIQFCGRKCKDIGQRIESGIVAIQPPHYKSSSQFGASYRVFAFRHYPHVCNRCGYDKYEDVLEVHHKDRNRSNNSVDNLEILCPTCHCEEHFLNKK